MITTPNRDEISIEADDSDDPESLALPGSQREILPKAGDRQVDHLRQQRNILKKRWASCQRRCHWTPHAEHPRKQDALIEELLAVIARDPLPASFGLSEPRARKRKQNSCNLLTQ